MDEIQKVLVEQGRKDLAQQYFVKVQNVLKQKVINKKAAYAHEDKLSNVQPDSARELALASVKIYFNDQKLMNLWKNELSGQMSDGAWENTPKTEWLWQAAVGRGPRNEIIVDGMYQVGKQSYGWNTLLSISEIKERMIVGNGFANENELKRALGVITTMIKSPREDSEARKTKQTEEQKVKDEHKDRISTFMQRHPEFKIEYEHEGPKFESKTPRQYFVLQDIKDGKVYLKIGGTFELKSIYTYGFVVLETQLDEFIKHVLDAAALVK